MSYGKWPVAGILIDEVLPTQDLCANQPRRGVGQVSATNGFPGQGCPVLRREHDVDENSGPRLRHGSFPLSGLDSVQSLPRVPPFRLHPRLHSGAASRLLSQPLVRKHVARSRWAHFRFARSVRRPPDPRLFVHRPTEPLDTPAILKGETARTGITLDHERKNGTNQM